jgi:hypothetical protein
MLGVSCIACWVCGCSMCVRVCEREMERDSCVYKAAPCFFACVHIVQTIKRSGGWHCTLGMHKPVAVAWRGNERTVLKRASRNLLHYNGSSGARPASDGGEVPVMNVNIIIINSDTVTPPPSVHGTFLNHAVVVLPATRWASPQATWRNQPIVELLETCVHRVLKSDHRGIIDSELTNDRPLVDNWSLITRGSWRRWPP